MKTEEVELEVPAGYQLILGQAHFIKTLEDLYETLVASMPEIKFGVAFCEASGKALVRFESTDQKSSELAQEYALKVRAGHSFVVVLNGAYPINVLNRIKMLDEVAGIFCATSNRLTVLVAETESGRGILGVVDGVSATGVESPEDRAERHELLRKIGYKK